MTMLMQLGVFFYIYKQQSKYTKKNKKIEVKEVKRGKTIIISLLLRRKTNAHVRKLELS